MIDLSEVGRLLFERCEGLPLPVAFPEAAETFTPPADGRYYEIRFFPNRHAWEGISSGLLGQGLLQINVVWPKNRGVLAPYAAARDAKLLFPKALPLFGAGVKVSISSEPTDDAPLTEGSEVKIPLTIRWDATAV